MALDPLAVTADLTARGVDVTNVPATTAALAAASASVRDAAGVPILSTESTVALLAPEGCWLDLPGGPVSAVDTVLIGAVDVSANAVLREGRLYLAAGWRQGLYPFDQVTVTYTHGLIEVPADIVDLVCALAAASLAATASDYAAQTNVAMEAIDDYRVGFVTGEDAAVSVVELPQRTRDRLAARFGGGAYVTSSR